MTKGLNVGVIGGGGWLGGAIARAIVDAGLVPATELTLSYRSRKPASIPGAHLTDDNRELIDRADIVIVSVRPADWPSIALPAHGKLVVSVMAGIRIADIAGQMQTQRVVRSLPNAAAELARSYTPWVASAAATEADRAAVRAIFAACGTTDELASEADIDYLTGLSGSGPAFPALLAAAMMKDAVAHGLEAAVARRAVTAVLIGTGYLFEAHDDDPEALVETFVAYRGTTAAAIDAMRAAGFDAAVGRGLAAALAKSAEMGKAS